MMEKKVKEFMEMDPPTVKADGTLRDALEAMLSKKRSGAVVKEGKDTVGLIGADDIAGILTQGRELDKVKVSQFLKACSLVGENPCLQINEESLVLDAIRVMQLGSADRILVVNAKGDLVGSISLLDALRAWEGPD